MFEWYQDMPNACNNIDTRCYKLQYMYKSGVETHYNLTKKLQPR